MIKVSEFTRILIISLVNIVIQSSKFAHFCNFHLVWRYRIDSLLIKWQPTACRPFFLLASWQDCVGMTHLSYSTIHHARDAAISYFPPPLLVPFVYARDRVVSRACVRVATCDSTPSTVVARAIPSIPCRIAS